ncbi:MAG: NUDIX hydrolase [Erysipelotrichaceae bacterium]|nr:NUDIX hydrolase [Erysipelotrichaceae bacterium]MBR6233630.1 NUDIX hydrolase [Erysipelotrichaceae bacterium]
MEAALRAYRPYNIQEEKDKETILSFLERYDDAYERSNELAHMTASAWVVNPDKTKVLMAYHRIYDSWAWLGGHCDGNKDCLAVAIREVREEAGVENVVPLSEDIFSLEVLSVDSHYKRGEYVPTHLHLNVTYLLQADEKEDLHIKEDENSNVSWFGLDEAIERSNEEWFKQNIYKKLNEKLREIYEND